MERQRQRQPKTLRALSWLSENPDKNVPDAARKFKISPSAIYNAKRATVGRDSLLVPVEDHLQPMLFQMGPQVQQPETTVIIIRTQNPAAVLRDLFKV